MRMLRPQTQEKYREGLRLFNDFCLALGAVFNEMYEDSQDFLLADAVLQLTEEGHLLHGVRCTVAATQRLYGGRRNFKTAKKVVTSLAAEHPPEHAPPFPQELLFALCVVLAAYGQPGVQRRFC